jgi:hypothetical protein
MENRETNGERPEPAGSRGVSRRRRWALRLVIVLLALIVAVGLCEALLWILAPIKYHEWMLWQAEGHIRGRALPHQVFKTADGYEVRINKDGFRGSDYPYEKPPGTLRIVVLGGSSSFCYHAEGEESTWPKVLESRLRERLDIPVEVVNLALPGFSAFSSKFNYLCYGRAFHPDAILVYHTWNNMQAFRAVEKRPYHYRHPLGNKPLWQRIARATQIGRRGRHFLWTAQGRHLEGHLKEVLPGASRPVHPKALAWDRKNYEDLVLLAKSDGVLPILASQASLACEDSIDDPEIRLALAPACGSKQMTVPVLVDTHAKVTKLIEEVARENDAVFLNGYDAVPHTLKYLRDGVHLYDIGYQKLAGEFARGLLNDQCFLDLVDRVREESESRSAESLPAPGSQG